MKTIISFFSILCLAQSVLVPMALAQASAEIIELEKASGETPENSAETSKPGSNVSRGIDAVSGKLLEPSSISKPTGTKQSSSLETLSKTLADAQIQTANNINFLIWVLTAISVFFASVGYFSLRSRITNQVNQRVEEQIQKWLTERIDSEANLAVSAYIVLLRAQDSLYRTLTSETDLEIARNIAQLQSYTAQPQPAVPSSGFQVGDIYATMSPMLSFKRCVSGLILPNPDNAQELIEQLEQNLRNSEPKIQNLAVNFIENLLATQNFGPTKPADRERLRAILRSYS